MTVRLKTLRLEDVEQIVAWQKDEAFAEFFRLMPPGFVWSDPRYIDAYLAGFQGIWIDEVFAGLAVLKNNDTHNKSIEFGIMVDKKQTPKRREVATNALTQLMAYVFDYMGYNKFYCKFLEHRKDLALYAREHKFLVEGVLRESCFWKGTFHNEVVVSILAKDYKEN